MQDMTSPFSSGDDDDEEVEVWILVFRSILVVQLLGPAGVYGT